MSNPTPAEIEAAWARLVEVARIEAKHSQELAKSRRVIYRAHIEAGWSEEQALWWAKHLAQV